MLDDLLFCFPGDFVHIGNLFCSDHTAFLINDHSHHHIETAFGPRGGGGGGSRRSSAPNPKPAAAKKKSDDAAARAAKAAAAKQKADAMKADAAAARAKKAAEAKQKADAMKADAAAARAKKAAEAKQKADAMKADAAAARAKKAAEVKHKTDAVKAVQTQDASKHSGNGTHEHGASHAPNTSGGHGEGHPPNHHEKAKGAEESLKNHQTNPNAPADAKQAAAAAKRKEQLDKYMDERARKIQESKNQSQAKRAENAIKAHQNWDDQRKKAENLRAARSEKSNAAKAGAQKDGKALQTSQPEARVTPNGQPVQNNPAQPPAQVPASAPAAVASVSAASGSAATAAAAPQAANVPSSQPEASKTPPTAPVSAKAASAEAPNAADSKEPGEEGDNSEGVTAEQWLNSDIKKKEWSKVKDNDKLKKKMSEYDKMEQISITGDPKAIAKQICEQRDQLDPIAQIPGVLYVLGVKQLWFHAQKDSPCNLNPPPANETLSLADSVLQVLQKKKPFLLSAFTPMKKAVNLAHSKLRKYMEENRVPFTVTPSLKHFL